MQKSLQFWASFLAVSLVAQAGWAQTSPPGKISYETLVVDGLARAGGSKLPSGEPIFSSPITSTLIFGQKDAILVDPPMSVGQTREVIDWIVRSGKHLKIIYATHGHGDHWAGTKQILDRFPDAVPYATAETIKHMHEQLQPERLKLVERDFPGQLGETPVLARPMPAGGLELEGNAILAVDVGHTDTDDTTVLYVPAIGLVVAGDAVYNGVHALLLESGNGGLDAWLRGLDKIEALRPQFVVAGHKNRALADDPKAIGETRQYLLDAKRLLAAKPEPVNYYNQMRALYPAHLNSGPLWYSGVVLLGGANVLTNSK